MSLAVANQYAKALFEATENPAAGLAPEQALEQLKSFSEALASSHELHEVLMSPAVQQAAKSKALSRLSSLLGLHRLISNFVTVVAHHRRMKLFPEICQMFQSTLDERRGVAHARVSSAKPLNDAQKADLAAQLSRKTGKQVRFEYDVDPALVGGLTVKIGSSVYDGSVRGQLDGLRRRLASEA
jgi:F-type H+-transporting ATPase subunit delta